MKEKLRIVPLGGLNEIGKNITLIEYGNDIIIIDCGLAFPDGDMLGVDLVIPDITYLKRYRQKIRGIVITHGHEDHIGALPYVLREINVPIYCTKLTWGIIENKLAEHKLDKVKSRVIPTGGTFNLGKLGVEFIRTNHSIADSVALAITTPLGVIIHTGDFKVDFTPVGSPMIDLARFGELGTHGVLALMSDSTNVEKPGYTMSESKVAAALDAQFKNCSERIIIASFASNVHRLQQIIEIANKYNRKVALSGRSMENIMNVAVKLGYVDIPKGVLIDLNTINKYPKDQLVIVTTGSQGETMSALYRMAFSGHKQVQIVPGDKILISATPIPGNEKSVYRMINELFKKGADVVYEKLAAIHVSGHACQEELKLMLALTRPKYFVPVHGEHRHLKMHGALAREMGISAKNIFISETGKPVEITATSAHFGTNVPAGKVLVDGLGVGDVGTAVLRDRKHLSQDGLIVIVVTIDSASKTVIAGPDIVSRGFIYVKEAEDLIDELRRISVECMDTCMASGSYDWNGIKGALKSEVSEYLYKNTKRSPMILPVIQEI